MAKSNYIGNDFDIAEIYSQLYGYVSPPFPAGGNLEGLIPNNPLDTLQTVFDSQTEKTVLGVEMVMPLTLSIPDLDFKLQVEPIISISGANKIKRRYPSASNNGGSIKERWSSDDYTVRIKGVLIDFENNIYPASEVKKLRRILEYKGNVKVLNPLLTIFGIEQISINAFAIPNTTGLSIQQYSINAYSDQLFNALLTEV